MSFQVGKELYQSAEKGFIGFRGWQRVADGYGMLQSCQATAALRATVQVFFKSQDTGFI